jgi:hypothetical protein
VVVELSMTLSERIAEWYDHESRGRLKARAALNTGKVDAQIPLTILSRDKLESALLVCDGGRNGRSLRNTQDEHRNWRIISGRAVQRQSLVWNGSARHAVNERATDRSRGPCGSRDS